MNAPRFLIGLSLVLVLPVSSAWAEIRANNTDCAPFTRLLLVPPYKESFPSFDDFSLAVNPKSTNDIIVSVTDYSTDTRGQSTFAVTVNGATAGAWAEGSFPHATSGGKTYTNSEDARVYFDSSGNAFYIVVLTNSDGSSALGYGKFTGLSPPTLSTPVAIATLPPGSSQTFEDPELVELGTGKFLAVYDLGGGVFKSESSDGGATWGTPVLINFPTLVNPKLSFFAAGANTTGPILGIVVDTASGTQRAIEYSKSTDQGKTWSPLNTWTVYTPTVGAGPFHPIGAVAAYNQMSKLVVDVWSDQFSGISRINYGSYNPATNAWAAPVQIDTGTAAGHMVINPSLAINEQTGQNFIIWHDFRETSPFSYQQFGTMTNNGKNFSKPLAFTAPLTPGSAFKSRVSDLEQFGGKLYWVADGTSATLHAYSLSEPMINFVPIISAPSSAAPGTMFNVDVGGSSSVPALTDFTLTVPTGLEFESEQAGDSNFTCMEPAVGASGTIVCRSTINIFGFTFSWQVKMTAPAGSSVKPTLNVFGATSCSDIPAIKSASIMSSW